MSSQNALRAAATGTDAATSAPAEPKTIAHLLTDPRIKEQMALALPRHMTADRLARIALTEVRRTPDLGLCSQASFLGAIMQCAALGLEPGGALGHCYLLPFFNNKTGMKEVQFIVGYRGMLDLSRRSGQIQSIEARAVYQKDKFSVSLGLDSNITHEPAWTEVDRGDLTFVYAVAKLKDGGIQFDVMSRTEVDKIRARSKAGKSGPWVSDYDEMAKKTVVRRLFKYLPVSIEMQRAVGLDEAVDVNVSQHNAGFLGDAFEHPAIEHKPGEQAAEQAVEQAHTFDSIKAALEGATKSAELNDAADLITTLEGADNAGDRAELVKVYQARLSQVA